MDSKKPVVMMLEVGMTWVPCYIIILVVINCMIILQFILFINKGNSLWYLHFSLYLLDTVFFHLPPRNGNGATVYGISCYRQIEAKVW